MPQFQPSFCRILMRILSFPIIWMLRLSPSRIFLCSESWNFMNADHSTYGTMHSTYASLFASQISYSTLLFQQYWPMQRITYPLSSSALLSGCPPLGFNLDFTSVFFFYLLELHWVFWLLNLSLILSNNFFILALQNLFRQYFCLEPRQFLLFFSLAVSWQYEVLLV